MSNEKETNYYLKKKRIVMRTFDAAMLIVKQILIENFGEAKFAEISLTARREFENLLPNLPYVGGNDSHLTNELINASLLLPLLQAFEKEGLSFNEIGKLTYELYEAFYKVMKVRRFSGGHHLLHVSIQGSVGNVIPDSA